MDNTIVDKDHEKGDCNYYELKLFSSKKHTDDTQYYRRGGDDDFHLQQNVAGRPVYVEGPPPPPINAARTGAGQVRTIPVETFDETMFYNSFNTKEIRHRFVRKVYFLLFILLAVTTGVIAIFVFEPNVNNYARKHPYLAFIFLILSMVIYMALACVQSLRKSFPVNFILLAVFTIISAIGYGYVAALYSKDIVLYSAAITAGVCLLITLLACQPWIDITGWGKYLCILSIIAMVFGLILMILGFTIGVSKIVHLIYSSIIALLFCLYFLYTTQLILGGKKYELSPEEYVLGAIVLYVEVMSLFMTIMALFAGARS